jgi:AbiU2
MRRPNIVGCHRQHERRSKGQYRRCSFGLGPILASAWSYFYLLRGIDQGSRQSPEVVNRFGLLYDRAWRAIFDGFFAKVGTLLDSTKGTHSLPNLVILIRRYGTSDLKQLIPEVDACLAKKDSPLAKLQSWRHSAVAHKAANRRDPDFYIDNRMTLTQIEGALMQLEELLNHLSWNVLAIHNDTRSGFESLVEEGKAFFACAAAGVQSASKAEPEL